MTQNIRLEDVPSNNHGCSGFWIDIEITGERTGTVTATHQCTANCHGMPFSNWWKVGQEITLPEEFESWDDAAEWVDDEKGFSDAGHTELKP